MIAGCLSASPTGKCRSDLDHAVDGDLGVARSGSAGGHILGNPGDGQCLVVGQVRESGILELLHGGFSDVS